MEPESENLQAALRFADAGMAVFPCVPGGKAPLTSNGFHDASRDPDQIGRWWTTRPHANIAAPTGAPGFDVLDVDVRTNGTGWAALDQLRRAGLTDGWLRMLLTPSGGVHLHYPGTDQRNGSLPGRHLDYRGQGGYVLLPPSVVQSKHGSATYLLWDERPGPGRPFDWAAAVALLNPLQPRPDDSVRARSRATADPIPWLARHVAKQTEGNRNNALFWASHRALEARVADLEPLIAAGVAAGLTPAEARRTVDSARADGRRRAEPAGTPSGAAPSR